MIVGLALALGGLSARETAPDPSPAVEETQADARAAKRYGPNPAYRLTPQINRIIRVAADRNDEKSGSGGTQLKSTPVQKKETAPVLKKQTAPVTKKKQTAPAAKKKQTVPVTKKKETAPAAKKKEPAPVTEKKEPTPKQPAPKTGPSDEQVKQNEAFCAKNPTSPKCAGAAEDQPAKATEKICTANPKYPGCDKLNPPGLPPPPEDAGGVGSICEQNPQLPQCQVQKPEEKAPPPPPPGPDGDTPPPGFPPPDAPPSIPPAPPPGPPPPPSDDGEAAPPSGPQIQTVTECPEGQVEFAGVCQYPGNCPDGQVQYNNQCQDSCPEDMFERLGGCIGGFVCVQQGGLKHDDLCLSECPENTVAHGGSCLDQCPGNLVNAGGQCVECPEGQANVNGQCVAACPTGSVREGGQCLCPEGQRWAAGVCVLDCPQDRPFDSDGECVAQCPDDTYRTPDNQCVAQCPEGYLIQYDRCEQQCNTGFDYIHDGQCLFSCPQGTIPHEGQCLSECPEGMVTLENNSCAASCPEGQDNVNGQCGCPDGQFTSPSGLCAPDSCPGGTYRAADYQCVAQCPEGSSPESNLGSQPYCAPHCPAGQLAEFTRCVEQCGQGYPTQQDGVCLGSCPEGTILSGNQCLDSCPEGQLLSDQNNQCVESCPEGYAELDGRCQQIGETGCLGDQVRLDGQCIPRQECYQGGDSGRVPYEGECRDKCPNGMPQLGSMCLEECPGNYFEEGGRCRIYCPPDASGPEWNFGACATCPSGTAYYRSQCLAECPGGIAPVDGQCVAPSCENGSLFIDGVCTSLAEVGYEDFLEFCVGEFSGEESQETCQNLVDDMCTNAGGSQGTPANIVPLCLQRPCSEGRENVNGQCLEACPEDQVRNSEGNCEAAASDETPSPDAGTPPEAQSPDGTQPPPDTGTPPPDDGEAPPPADEAPPPADEAPPPPAEEAPTPADEAPPPEAEAPPPADDGEAAPPPANEAPPPADEAPPPDNGEAPPPPADETPPPDQTAPPPADGTPPPGAPPAPPSTGEAPPSPPPPSGGTPPAAPPKSAKPSLEDVAKESPIPLKQPPTEPVAVVIGIGDYEDPGLGEAPQAIANAAHIVRFVKTDIGIEGDRILTGRNATLSDFEDIFGRPGGAKSELGELVKATKTPEVIVYFAGRAQALDGGKDVLLLPSDADPAKAETGVRLSALYNNLAAMGIPRLRVYLDPSFAKSDGVVEVAAGPRIGPFGLFTPPNWVTLSAASDSAPVADDPKRKRSLFTDSLVVGLRGIADTTGEGDRDGTISAGELYQFTRDQAAAAAKRGGKQPVPSLYGKPTEALRTY